MWVDGDVISFGGFPTGEVVYNNLPTRIPQSSAEDAGDLAPVGIGSAGADVTVSDIRLSRDVYYRVSTEPDYDDVPWTQEAIDTNAADEANNRRRFHAELSQFLSDPSEWPGHFSQMASSQPYVLQHFPDNPAKDQFFAAGDNSPASSDSRLWMYSSPWTQHYFERELLIGKAIFIYWPHSLNKPFPFFPNFKQMGFVR